MLGSQGPKGPLPCGKGCDAGICTCGVAVGWPFAWGGFEDWLDVAPGAMLVPDDSYFTVGVDLTGRIPSK